MDDLGNGQFGNPECGEILHMDVAVLTPKKSVLGFLERQRFRFGIGVWIGEIISLRVELVFKLRFLFHKYLRILCKN